MAVKLSQQALRSAGVLFQDIGGEAVLLDPASENYFGLDPVGARLWALLGENPQLQHAFDVLCAEYEVEPAQLEADLLALVGQLADARLVELR